ncbi:MAG: hypothetical protein A2428_12865 [Bdellovibrionales bacterium RIFOXYC1_FULL_54_43]|nr:MAG: hypothetical protein A2428_12865 [Bdellovibrionales bacterium RIFOXYC1_FULL_54_43]OFZ83097.1 MAG: hypothetical protein A2603_05575 [Bdellovibrionales bacterium RIFOXYD1_FULL_55_31]
MSVRPPLIKQSAPVMLMLIIGMIASPAASGRDKGLGFASESKDRSVDSVALGTYYQAVVGISKLLKQNRDTPREPGLLLRLAETYQKAAGVEFRVAHARGGVVNLRNYEKLLQHSLVPLNRMIQVYPNHPEVAIAYNRRAKSFKELGRKNEAIQDLKLVIDRYPGKLDLTTAYLTLCDLLFETKDYRTAIFYLKLLNARPTDSNYPLIMEKFAWAHYYLTEVSQGLEYLFRIKAGLAVRKGQPRSADREGLFSNVALFYGTGIEAKLQGFEAGKALAYFKSFEPGPEFSKIVIAFAYLLRSKGLNQELELFRTQALASDLSPSDQLELLLITLGNQSNRRRYAEMQNTAAQIATLWSKNSELASVPKLKEKTVKILTESSEGVLAAFAAARKQQGDSAQLTSLVPIGHAVINLYRATLSLLSAESGTSAFTTLRQRIYFNLGEVSFHIREFQNATNYYRWIAENAPPESELAVESGMRAIASYYEKMREDKVVPGQLTAASFQNARKKDVPKPVQDWIGWVRSAAQQKDERRRVAAEVFVFEANRILYSLGHVSDAVSELIAFTKACPKSSYASGSAALAIDTYVASGDWPTANALAVEFGQYANWKGTGFEKKLGSIASDTSFKMIEGHYRNGEYAVALEKADAFLKLNRSGRYSKNCLSIAANAALALKDKKRAMQYLALAADKDAPPEVVSLALLTSASLAEERYDFAAAASAYREYLSKAPDSAVSAEDRTAMVRKILLFVWLAKDSKALKSALENPKYCGGKALAVDCERLNLWTELTERSAAKMSASESAGWAKVSFEGMKEVDSSNRIYWAMIGVNHSKALPTKDRAELFSEFAAAWKKTEPLYRFALLPYLSDSVPDAVRDARERLRSMSPLKLDPASIKKRAKLIESLEAAFEALLELPSVRLRSVILNENAQFYSDFSKDLGALSKTKGISAEEREAFDSTLSEMRNTLRDKAKDLRKRAFELASGSGVEASALESLISDYASEFPDLAKGLMANHKKPVAAAITPDLLDQADISGGWGQSTPTQAPGAAPATRSASEELKREWSRALREKNWGKVAFLLELAGQGESPLLSSVQIALARSISLAGAGAQAEGVLGIEEIKTKLDEAHRKSVLGALVAAYYGSYSREKVQKTIEELSELDSTEDLLSGLGDVIRWSNSKMAIKTPASQPSPAKEDSK